MSRKKHRGVALYRACVETIESRIMLSVTPHILLLDSGTDLTQLTTNSTIHVRGVTDSAHPGETGTDLGGVGNDVTARWEWNFDDPYSDPALNKMPGFNAAHVYSHSGDYEISLTVTDETGTVSATPATLNIHVDAEDDSTAFDPLQTQNYKNRKQVYIWNEGANGDGTQDTPFTLSGLRTYLSGNSASNTRFYFKAGDSFSFSSALAWSGQNILISSYGSGAKPLMQAATGYGTDTPIFTTSSTSRNITFKGLQFDSADTNGYTAHALDDTSGSVNVTMRDCDFGDIDAGIQAEATGIFFWNNHANVGLRKWLFYGADADVDPTTGTDYVLVGNSVSDSYEEHNTRIYGSRVLTYDNDFTNLPAYTGSPIPCSGHDIASIRTNRGSHQYWANNVVHAGQIVATPLGADSPGALYTDEVDNVVIENNVWKQVSGHWSNIPRVLIGDFAGVDKVMVRNNIIEATDAPAIKVNTKHNFDGDPNQPRYTTNVYILNNTGINPVLGSPDNKTAVSGHFIQVTNFQQDVITLKNNLYVAPALDGNSTHGAIQADRSDEKNFVAIANNVWPAPSNVDTSGHGVIDLGNSGSTSLVTKTNWLNASLYPRVSNDAFQALVVSDLDANYAPTSGTTAANVALSQGRPINGVFTDWLGQLRDRGASTWAAGAADLTGQPSAPSDLTATVSSVSPSVSVDLTWTDNSDNEDGFSILRKTGAGGSYASIGTNSPGDTTFSDTTAGGGSDYYYEIVATSTANGDSDPSSELYVPVPTSGSALTVTGTSGNDTIALSVSGGSSDRVLSYNGETVTYVSATVSSLTVNGGAGNDAITIDSSVTFATTLNGGDGNDTAAGGAGADAIYGDPIGTGTGSDSLLGGGGNDSLYGDGGGDYLDGQAGNDSLAGQDGSDTLYAGTASDGADTLSGGNDGDRADYGGRTNNLTITLDGTANDGESGESDNVSTDIETVFGGNGNDYLSATGISTSIQFKGIGGNDTLIGGSGPDSLTGDPLGSGTGNDSILGGGGNDSMVGDGGDDYFDGQGGNDTMSGGDGDDVFYCGTAADGADTLSGGNGNDTADYSGRTNALTITLNVSIDDGESGELDKVGVDVETVIGGNGSDSISASGVTNGVQLKGGPGNDTLTGGSGADSLNGDPIGNGTGNDSILGGAGNDSMFGDGGNDYFDGQADNDSMSGGDGNDTFNCEGAADGADTLSGGNGIDKADYSTRTNALTITLNTTSDDGESGELDKVGVDVESVLGGNGNDSINASGITNAVSLYGGAGADSLTSGTGNDSLEGGAGNDSLVAGSGDDTLNGLANNDTMSGGDGNDLFQTGSAADGSDTLSGGNGIDKADYSGRSNPLTITLNTSIDDGESGELDKVGVDVESVFGGGAADTISASTLTTSVSLYGAGGADTITGGSGADYLEGGSGNDSMVGGSGDDTFNGLAGNDNLSGGLGNDYMQGGDDNDVLTGDGNNDSMFGEFGDDTIFAQDGVVDAISGGPGTDSAQKDVSDSPVTGIEVTIP